MRKIYSAELDKQFVKLVASIWPRARRVRVSRIDRPDSSSLSDTFFVLTGKDEPSLYLVLRRHVSDDRFYVDVAWSKRGGLSSDTKLLLSASPIHGPELQSGMVGLNGISIPGVSAAPAGYAIWECSADIKDPNFKRIFAAEYSARVPPEEVERRVKVAITALNEDLLRTAIPFFGAVLSRP